MPKSISKNFQFFLVVTLIYMFNRGLLSKEDTLKYTFSSFWLLQRWCMVDECFIRPYL